MTWTHDTCIDMTWTHNTCAIMYSDQILSNSGDCQYKACMYLCSTGHGQMCPQINDTCNYGLPETQDQKGQTVAGAKQIMKIQEATMMG